MVGVKASAIIGIILLAGAAYAGYLAYPKIEVVMVYTDQNLVNSQNIEALIAKDDAGSNFYTKVCFNVKNTASILGDQLPANNFNVGVKTEGATCKNCNSDTAHRVLKAQETEQVCRNLQTSSDTEEFSIHVFTHGDALGFDLDKEYIYTCSRVGEVDNRNKYNCGQTAIRSPDKSIP